MIKALRRKFIAITMVSVLLVLGGIIAAINGANYCNICATADARLTSLASRMPASPGMVMEEKKYPDFRAGKFELEDRYFAVLLTPAGEPAGVDTGHLDTVSETQAVEYAQAMQQQGRRSGFLGQFRYQAAEAAGATAYLFLDCGREMTTFYSFLWASIAISAAGVLLVFLLVVVLSRRAVRPVAESYEKQRRFITDASHELKTPLAILSANAEVLEMENGASEWTSSIRHQVARLSDLTEKLVLLCRMEEGERALPFADFSLSRAVRETAENFVPIAAAKGLEFSITVEPGLSLCGNEGAIRQLVSLLLDNAMKYTNDRGTVALTLGGSGGSKVLTLYNTVTEIPPGSQNQLFERFYRPDNSRSSRTGGSGIGLSVAQAIVTAHKGRITADSRDGRSITFTVLL